MQAVWRGMLPVTVLTGLSLPPSTKDAKIAVRASEIVPAPMLSLGEKRTLRIAYRKAVMRTR